MPAIYTRGDINPRHITILPVNPLEVPVVQAAGRVVANLLDTAGKLGGGADIKASLLEGLEHNGVSRPLAGFASVFQGYATTSKGSLISAASDFDAIATFARLGGSKPMGEAIALDALYRSTAYKAKDKERLADLGEIVKTKLRAGSNPSQEELESFMVRYAASGGKMDKFAQSLQGWNKNANVSVVNQMRMQLGSPLSQRMMEVMGGEPLGDFYNQNER
jgi:hypothetical protein